MKERDYVNATNLARVRAIADLLRQVTPCEAFPDADRRNLLLELEEYQ